MQKVMILIFAGATPIALGLAVLVFRRAVSKVIFSRISHQRSGPSRPLTVSRSTVISVCISMFFSALGIGGIVVALLPTTAPLVVPIAVAVCAAISVIVFVAFSTRGVEATDPSHCADDTR